MCVWGGCMKCLLTVSDILQWEQQKQSLVQLMWNELGHGKGQTLKWVIAIR